MESESEKLIKELTKKYGPFSTLMIKIAFETIRNLNKSYEMHDIRRHNGNIDKDYIRDEKGKKVYLTYEEWKERN